MKKKVFSKLLMVALVATVGAFTSCKDYDDDINDLRSQINGLETSLKATIDKNASDAANSLAILEKQLADVKVAYADADAALCKRNAGDLEGVIIVFSFQLDDDLRLFAVAVVGDGGDGAVSDTFAVTVDIHIRLAHSVGKFVGQRNVYAVDQLGCRRIAGDRHSKHHSRSHSCCREGRCQPSQKIEVCHFITSLLSHSPAAAG